MKFVKNLIAFALAFFITYTFVTLLMEGFDFNKIKYDNIICFTTGATIGYGLVTYFQGKKKKEN